MGHAAAAAVTDAGPLIHLTEIDALHVLTIFESLHVPQAVWAETVEQGRASTGGFATLQLTRHSLLPAKVAQFVQTKNLTSLHPGEQECLFLCQQLGVSLLLTDDLAARDAARRLGFTPVGSLGVVVRAYHHGVILLSDAERLLTDLYSISSLFVASAIVEIAIQQLRLAK
ncbi:MAG: nucleic acid-binding protein [Chloroflexi bacterium]|nr:nucleic acid-binding protein [Chloroflexota bacterium]